ncbi:MAG: hypothetical protein EXR72_25420 [Myxococcales bacterium]|nr:hypothetical protein [Myxococcales bacterium]
MRRTLLCAVLLLSGCPEETAPPPPAADTESPKDSPVPYKVLKDETINNSVEYHVLIAEGVKHDQTQELLKFLYRHTSIRKDSEPAAVATFVYTSEAAYATPPRTPVAQVLRKSGERGPTFDNKVPLEFWQEIKVALEPAPGTDGRPTPRRDDKWKLKLKVERDDGAKSVTLTQPYTEQGEDKWAEKISFNQALQEFTDAARALYDNVPDLRSLTFVGLWQDKEVLRITLAKADYGTLNLHEIDERIGQHHGTAFLKLSTGKGTDQSVAKENAAMIAKEYRTMLAGLKGKANVSPTLK